MTDKAAENPRPRTEVPTCLLRCEWPRNPGLSPGDPQFDAMLASVRAEGVLEPLTINLGWYVVDGQHRLYAARDLGIERVPVRIWTGVEFVE